MRDTPWEFRTSISMVDRRLAIVKRRRQRGILRLAFGQSQQPPPPPTLGAVVASIPPVPGGRRIVVPPPPEITTGDRARLALLRLQAAERAVRGAVQSAALTSSQRNLRTGRTSAAQPNTENVPRMSAAEENSALYQAQLRASRELEAAADLEAQRVRWSVGRGLDALDAGWFSMWSRTQNNNLRLVGILNSRPGSALRAEHNGDPSVRIIIVSGREHHGQYQVMLHIPAESQAYDRSVFRQRFTSELAAALYIRDEFDRMGWVFSTARLGVLGTESTASAQRPPQRQRDMDPKQQSLPLPAGHGHAGEHGRLLEF